MDKHRKHIIYLIYGLVAINIAFLLGAVYRLRAENKVLKSLIESRADGKIGGQNAAYNASA
jgi:hypothetical protein